MSKFIAREQVNAINAKMSNGFQLDVCSLMLYGEKKAVKSIKLDDATTLVATLTFAASFDKKRNSMYQMEKATLRWISPSGIAIRVPTLPLLAVWAGGSKSAKTCLAVIFRPSRN